MPIYRYVNILTLKCLPGLHKVLVILDITPVDEQTQGRLILYFSAKEESLHAILTG